MVGCLFGFLTSTNSEMLNWVSIILETSLYWDVILDFKISRSRIFQNLCRKVPYGGIID